jgi:hypothetical protein
MSSGCHELSFTVLCIRRARRTFQKKKKLKMSLFADGRTQWKALLLTFCLDLFPVPAIKHMRLSAHISIRQHTSACARPFCFLYLPLHVSMSAASKARSGHASRARYIFIFTLCLDMFPVPSPIMLTKCHCQWAYKVLKFELSLSFCLSFSF